MTYIVHSVECPYCIDRCDVEISVNVPAHLGYTFIIEAIHNELRRLGCTIPPGGVVFTPKVEEDADEMPSV